MHNMVYSAYPSGYAPYTYVVYNVNKIDEHEKYDFDNTCNFGIL